MTWIKLVEREADFLKNYLLYENYIENFNKVFNRNHSDFLTVRKGNTFTHYVHESSGKEFSKFLKEKLEENPEFIKEILRKGKSCFGELVKFAEETNKKNLQKLSNFELKELANNYFRLYKAPYPYFNITVFSDELESNREVINNMAELRLIGRTNFNKTHELIEPLFQEIGKRFNLKVEEVKFLKPNEIIDLLSGFDINIPKKIADRQKCYFLHKEGKFELSENQEYIVEETLSEKIKGNGTFPSFYEGKVKVIKSKEDIEKMEVGGIMVLRMTTPDLISEGMKKAGAIITDEGGVTCHAAILSREFNIPALIGTRNATKILKDGDKVVVDTSKGTAVKSSR
jgi:phosphoenolpyruvate synthase/pyruvate phosphate dikinase